MELYIQKTKIFDTGTNSSTVNNYITDATKSWTTNEYKDYYVFILSGTGSGLIAKITSNNATTLNFAALTISLDTTSFYQIVDFPYERVEMFQDEKVSVTSSIQNYSDIGKLFTDYSQSFTIPASHTNNAIFSHWYESEVDGGYDARIRYNAFIEIDTVRFRDGNVQLEKANKKNGYVESYTLTFYGNLTQLKDNFGDDKLQSLDFSSFNHLYDSTNVKSRITTNVAGVKYPLIGNKKKYYYQDPLRPAEDITTLAGAIIWDELFPAIKVSDIFARIQAKYGITFTGSFFNLDQWTKLYLYLKQAEKLTFKSEPKLLNFTSYGSPGAPSGSWPEMNLITDTLTIFNWTYNLSNPAIYTVLEREQSVFVFFYPSSQIVPYTVYAYKNGILFSTFELMGDTSWIFIDILRATSTQVGQVASYTFKISSNSSLSFTFGIRLDKYEKRKNISTGEVDGSSAVFSASGTINTNTYIPIGNFMPDMKIVDFITGLIKAFNLMIIPKPNNTYEFLPLEMWYNAGKITDITEYVYSDEISIDKPKLFKTMNFTYEQSENVLNNAYRGLYQQNYGDLIYKSPSVNESSTYDIKLPFENVLFEVPKQGKLFQTATLVNKDNNPYTPKPMLIYCNGLVGTLSGADRIYVSNSTGAATTITNYQRFSNEYDSLPTDATHLHLMTMNFGNEQSSWYNTLAPQGLYFRHYKNYVDNLYDVKTRVLKVKALLPTSLLASNVIDSYGNTLGIALNDRLVIRDKRYIINSYTTDLTTKEASFELITDYRGADAASSVGFRFASFENFQTDKEELILDIELYLNDNESFDIKASTDFLSYTHTSNNKTDATLKVTIPANATAVDRLGVITLEYYRNGVKENDQYIFITQTAI
jgi:hypothetical protein